MSGVAEQLFHLGAKALIHDGHDNVLLLKITRKNGEIYWDLPGGRAAENEAVEDSLKREIYEETGLDNLSVQKHLGIFLTDIMIPITDRQRARLLMSVYLFSALTPPKIVTEDNMIAEWVSWDEALNNHIAYLPADLLNAIRFEAYQLI